MSSNSETTSSISATVRGCLSLIVVLGLVLFITNDFHFPDLMVGHTFSGAVNFASADKVCITPDRDEFPWLLSWWFGIKQPANGPVSVCGEVVLDGFQPLSLQRFVPRKCLPQLLCPPTFINSRALVNQRVQATLTWRTNANGDRVKTFLVLRQEP